MSHIAESEGRCRTREERGPIGYTPWLHATILGVGEKWGICEHYDSRACQSRGRRTPPASRPGRLPTIGLNVCRQWRLYIEPERLRVRRCVRRWVRSWARSWAPGSIVLEVGGGTFFLKPVVKAEVPMVTFISGEIALTNQTDVVMDASALPIATAAVDAVLALEVLEHLDSPQRLLDEASRVLRPGGHLVITVPFMFGVHDFRDYYRYQCRVVKPVAGG